MQFEFLSDATHVVPKDINRLLARNLKTAINTAFYEARRMIKSSVPRNSKNRAGEDRHKAMLQETVYLDKATVSTHYARLWTDNPVWTFRNDDMPAHDIHPRNEGGVLVFKIGGETIYAKVVHHPGSKGLHIWEHAEDYIDQQLPMMIDMAVRAALDERELTGPGEGSLTG